MSTLTLTNRSDSAITPEWIHIVPRGELPNPAAGVTQILDDAAIDAILANINSDRARLGDKWPGIYLGKEHHIYDPDQDSAALGWLKNFKVNAAGLWASTDGLTPIGKQAIADKLYKFTSFTAKRDQVQALEGDKVRILRIHTVGLTNNPNGADLLTPISNREAGSQKSEAGSQQPPAGAEKAKGERQKEKGEDVQAEDADAALIANKDGFVTIDGNVVFVGPENDTTDDKASEKKETKGVFGRDEVAVGVPRITKRKRENGTDGEIVTEIRAPGKVTDPDVWYKISDHSKLDAHVDARLDFATGKPPKRTDKAWSAWSGRRTGAKRSKLGENLTYDEAVKAAVDSVVLANTAFPSPNPSIPPSPLSVSHPQPQPTHNNMELAELKNRATALEAENATLKSENTTLKNRLTETESEQIAGLLDQHGVKTDPARAALLPVLLELKNRAERVQWLANVLPPAAAPAPAPSAPSAPAKPLTNRAAAGIPASAPGAKGKPADELEKRVRETMVQNRCSYADAFRVCKTKHAELLAQS